MAEAKFRRCPRYASTLARVRLRRFDRNAITVLRLCKDVISMAVNGSRYLSSSERYSDRSRLESLGPAL
jgi:hypothetical protein